MVVYKRVNLNQAESAKKVYTLSGIRGVDFTHSNSHTSVHRLPEALNLTWGLDPFIPQVRFGYKALVNIVGSFGFEVSADENHNIMAPVMTYNGIHYHSKSGKFVLHIHNKFLIAPRNSDGSLDISEATLYELEVESKKSVSFEFNGHLYIVGAGAYYRFNGEKIEKDIEFATVIKGRMGLNKDGAGGIILEYPNALSPKRIEGFKFEIGENGEVQKSFKTSEPIFKEAGYVIRLTSTGEIISGWFTLDNGTFTLAGDGNKATLTSKAKLPGDTIDIEYMSAKDLVRSESESLINIAGNGGRAYLLKHIGIVSDVVVSTSQAVQPQCTVEPVGVTSLRLTFDREIEPNQQITLRYRGMSYESEEYLQLRDCSIVTLYGGEQDSRVWLSGNPKYPNADFSSVAYDPNNFAVNENFMTKVGSDGSAIVGYIKHYDRLIIVKETNSDDGSLFLRTPGTFVLPDGSVKHIFKIEQGSVGIGAVSKRTFSYIQSEPVFLSEQGLVALVGSNVDNQRAVQDRSTLINSSLLQHKDALANAIGLYHDGKYHLFIDGFVYVCDERMRYQDELGRAQYEWYMWNQFPKVESATVVDGMVYFGASGVLYRMKNHRDIYKHSDTVDTFGTTHMFSQRYLITQELDFGSLTARKSIDNIRIRFNPKENISLKLYAIVDAHRKIYIGSHVVTSPLDFENIDFEEVAFGSDKATTIKSFGCNITGFNTIAFEVVVDEYEGKDKSDNKLNNTLGFESIQILYRDLGGSI